MMHFPPARAAAPTEVGLSGYIKLFARVETLQARVNSARAAASDSLERLNTAPRPEIGDGSAFMALLDLHRSDREALFEAMRQLDAARAALRTATHEATNP